MSGYSMTQDDDIDIFISDEDIDDYDSQDEEAQPSYTTNETVDRRMSVADSDDTEIVDEQADMLAFYTECFENINKFISEFIGDENFKTYTSIRKKSSNTPFIYESQEADSCKTAALVGKTQSKKGKRKNKNKNGRDRVTSGAMATTEKLGDPPEEKPKNKAAMIMQEKLKKKEMKDQIKALLPLEPPKPTVSLDDPEFHIVEVNGEFKYMKNDEHESFKKKVYRKSEPTEKE